MQVIRSLDELVSDIEDTSVVTNKHPMLTHGRAVMRQAGQQQQQQLSQPSVTDVVAAVARQLSEKFDLHDSFASLANH